jgi:hypothetical protein
VSGRRRAITPEVMRATGLRARGWKLIDIAAALGVSEATVSRWCQGVVTRREATGQSVSPVVLLPDVAPTEPPHATARGNAPEPPEQRAGVSPRTTPAMPTSPTVTSTAPARNRRDQLARLATKADGLAVHLEAIRKRAEARVARDLAAALREVSL